MEPLLIAVAGMLIIVACQFVAPKVRVAAPLILLVVGLVIGFLPQVGAIEIEPNIILEMVLPPLLFSAAVRMPTMDFRREMQAVAMLAIPLVFLSAFAVGFVINWLVPAISLPLGCRAGRGPVADRRGRHLDRETLRRLPPHHHGPRRRGAL